MAKAPKRTLKKTVDKKARSIEDVLPPKEKKKLDKAAEEQQDDDEDDSRASAKRGDMEICYGCGAKAEAHPFVVVVNASDVETDEKSERGFAHVPVCAACHRDPSHRTTPIKGHFFPREMADRARDAAGSPNIGG